MCIRDSAVNYFSNLLTAVQDPLTHIFPQNGILYLFKHILDQIQLRQLHMDIKSRIRKIIPIALLFVAAFFAGHFMAKGTAKETSAQLDSANDSWGLS